MLWMVWCGAIIVAMRLWIMCAAVAKVRYSTRVCEEFGDVWRSEIAFEDSRLLITSQSRWFVRVCRARVRRLASCAEKTCDSRRA